MAHLISFRTSQFDVLKEPPNPFNPIAGHGVLSWLRLELENAQYQCSEPDAEDWGWYIDVSSADASYLVGASADRDDASAPDAEWNLQVHKHRTWKDRLFGQNRMAPDDPLTALIERLVRADAAATEISVDRSA